MKHSIFLLLNALALTCILNCGHNEESHRGHKKKEPHEESHDNHMAHSEDSLPHSNASSLNLNKGEKWKMDDHTRKTMAKITLTFQLAGLDSADSDSIKSTGKILRSEIDTLIQGCTMKGPAHDELHKFLMEFIPAIEKIAQEGDSSQVKKIEGLLKSYPQYFM